MNLLSKTLKGITSFTLMLAILIGMMSNVIYIANQVDYEMHRNPLDLDDDHYHKRRIYSHYFDNEGLNAILHMYLLSLGEFDTDKFHHKGDFTQALLWCIFIFGTFMLQITFMNMLIAIMGEVFGAVSAEQAQSSLSERILLLNDFRLFLDRFFRLDLDG